MAHIANRSASPNPSRSQSPSPRAANPSKSAKKVPWVNPSYSKNAAFISPSSDIPQRNSGSRGESGASSLRVSFEHNENERDPNGLRQLNKARSPAAAPSKGTKNFMSPTISASSKVIAASPKRRILSERNDGTRSSLTSVSDSFDFMESEENVVKSEVGIGPQVPLDTTTPKVSKALPEGVRSEEGRPKSMESFDLEESLGSVGERNRDPKPVENNDPSVLVAHCASAIASLDDEPAHPPYDPKTNYLSPRPRFLHYRPKPRIERYLNEGEGFFGPGDGRQLEDRFSSESSDEASEQTEEIQSIDEQNVCEDDSSLSEVEAGEVGKEAHDAEPKSDDTTFLKETPPKSGFFTRSKFIKLFLLMIVASLFVSVIDTPITGISSFSALKHAPVGNLPASALRILEDPHLRDSFIGLKGHANLNLEKLDNRFRDWSISSIAHFQLLIANFAVAREEIGLFYLTNITATEVDRIEDLEGDEMGLEEEQELVADFRDIEAEESCRNDLLMEKTQIEAVELGKETGFSAEQERSDSMKDDMKDISEDTSTLLEHQPKETEDKIKEDPQTQISLDSTLNSLVLDQPTSEESGSYLGYQPLEIRDDVKEGRQTDIEIHRDAEKDYEGSHKPQTFHYANFGLGSESTFQTMLGMSSVVLALAAFIISLCVRQKHMSTAAYGRLSSHNKVISNPMSQKYMHFQSPVQSHLPETETMVGESGPSEVSSSLQNSLYFGQKRSRRGMEQDTFSHERDLRRDSVASSTSYGSFTTYERLSGKKGSQDDDSLTPVRRSSRIRNQVISP